MAQVCIFLPGSAFTIKIGAALLTLAVTSRQMRGHARAPSSISATGKYSNKCQDAFAWAYPCGKMVLGPCITNVSRKNEGAPCRHVFARKKISHMHNARIRESTAKVGAHASMRTGWLVWLPRERKPFRNIDHDFPLPFMAISRGRLCAFISSGLHFSCLP